jgi:hypothetical protein
MFALHNKFQTSQTFPGEIMMPLGVNFTNILQAAFSYKGFLGQLFHTKVLCSAFMCLQFRFVIFWQKDFGAKADHKILVQLTFVNLTT